MAVIGLFYGTNSGATEYVAGKIKEAFDQIELGLVEIYNIGQVGIKEIQEWDYLIFGVPTWYVGNLQDDWDAFLPEMDGLDLSGKKVAIFGLGDQYGYSSTFLDAVGTLAARVRECGGQLVGTWPAAGYEVEASLALEGDHFMGLAIDEDNEPKLTIGRVQAWVQQIAEEFGIRAGEPHSAG